MKPHSKNARPSTHDKHTDRQKQKKEKKWDQKSKTEGQKSFVPPKFR